MRATRPVFGLAAQTKRSVATGASNAFSTSISGGGGRPPPAPPVPGFIPAPVPPGPVVPVPVPPDTSLAGPRAESAVEAAQWITANEAMHAASGIAGERCPIADPPPPHPLVRQKLDTSP